MQDTTKFRRYSGLGPDGFRFGIIIGSFKELFTVKRMYSADRLTSSETTKLAEDIGKEAILRMTTAFYAKFKEDYHISKFLRNHDDPHEERLANWILEKMGLGSPWSNELYWRPDEEVQLAGGKSIAILDRTSAHVAAWYSPKRKPSEVGRRFKLDDCRIWMRLMFWAAEEEGLFQNEKFKKWYIQFIAHFVAVYEYTAPPFAEESAAWCLDPRNIEIYKESGRKMEDVINIDYATAKHRAKEAGYSLIL